MLSTADAVLLLWPETAGRWCGYPPLSPLPFLLAGGLIADLALAGRLDVDTQRVHVRGGAFVGRPLHDFALALLAATHHERDARHWVESLPFVLPDLDRRLRCDLRRRGVLHRRQRRFGPIGWSKDELAEPASVDQVRAAVRAALIWGETPDAFTRALIALLLAGGATDALVPRQLRGVVRGTAAAIAAGDPLSATLAAACATASADAIVAAAAVAMAPD
jgi:hypothetical protein